MLLILFGPTLFGFLILILSCYLTRRWLLILGSFVFCVLLHLLSAVIIGGGGMGYSESPTVRGDMTIYHRSGVIYFLVGLLLFIVILLIKFIYVRSHKPAA